jgi:hypothetical protein
MKKFTVVAALAAIAFAAPAVAEDKQSNWFAGPTVGSTWTQG